eukprot:717654-Pyramimonas_sp.AAC.1
MGRTHDAISLHRLNLPWPDLADELGGLECVQCWLCVRGSAWRTPCELGNSRHSFRENADASVCRSR